MSDCLSLSLTPWGKVWRKIVLRLLIKLESWPLIFPTLEIRPPVAESLARSHAKDTQDGSLVQMRGNGACQLGISVSKSKKIGKKNTFSGDSVAQDPKDSAFGSEQVRYISNGGRGNFSLSTKRGRKAINQDAMIAVQKFDSHEDMVFCGVFDGHGPEGHKVARKVRDVLPQKLSDSWKAQQPFEGGASFSSDHSVNESASQTLTNQDEGCVGDPALLMAWKESFEAAYKLTDRELLMNKCMDCVLSGTTAVTLVKKGNDLIVGNVGDSRAVLGTRMDDGSMIALPLTVDLKPNVPREAERIRNRKGRVFALRNEPLVHRVWLPNHNIPGLAMSRALGDFCVKRHGVISQPEVTYRRLTNKDEFVVLASDGVWDVLTNEQVVEIVASASDRSQVARTIVEKAAHAWKSKQAGSNTDDCAVVCLFL